MWGYSAPVQTQWALVQRLVKGRNRQHRLAHIQAQLLYAFARFGSRAGRSDQKELLRHADIQTTMNIYPQAVTPAKREAASKVADILWRM